MQENQLQCNHYDHTIKRQKNPNIIAKVLLL